MFHRLCSIGAMMLTRKQLELLEFIHSYILENKISPSFEEMKIAVNLRSKSGIFRLINGLAERGFIKQIKQRARALEIARMPHSLSENLKNPSLLKKSSQSNADVLPFNPAYIGNKSDFLNIPLYGRIAAGSPILAVADPGKTLDIPNSFLGTNNAKNSHKMYYALEISGDSMEEAGIFDGDMAIIEKSETAENGNIVVALINDHEATLKKYYLKQKKIMLAPANKRYETQIYSPNQVKIQGRLKTIIRKY